LRTPVVLAVLPESSGEISAEPNRFIPAGVPALKSVVKVPASALELSNAKPKHDVARHRLGVYVCRIKGVLLGGECNEA